MFDMVKHGMGSIMNSIFILSGAPFDEDFRHSDIRHLWRISDFLDDFLLRSIQNSMIAPFGTLFLETNRFLNGFLPMD